MKPDLTHEFAKLAPWIFKFRIDGADHGGEISALGDARVEQFFRFAPGVETILELGSLEGAHTLMLAKHGGVNRVLGLDHWKGIPLRRVISFLDKPREQFRAGRTPLRGARSSGVPTLPETEYFKGLLLEMMPGG
jgi:hypothetical protein